MATIEFTLSPDQSDSIALVIDTLKDEHEKLLALAMSLTRALAPAEAGDLDEMQPTTEYRLAQLIEERLSKTWLEDFIVTVLKEAMLTGGKNRG